MDVDEYIIGNSICDTHNLFQIEFATEFQQFLLKDKCSLSSKFSLKRWAERSF